MSSLMLDLLGLLLWPILLASWVTTARLAQLVGGRPLVHLKYDLINNTSGTCPESGTPIGQDWRPLF